MRRTVLIGILAMLIPATAAVVGANDTGGDMRITSSGSSASATTGVGPDGVAYRADITPRNASCATGNGTEPVSETSFYTRNASTDMRGVAFTGTIQAADPCHTIAHTVEQVNDTAYTLSITTEPGAGMCVQCVAAMTYRASFSAPDPFMLTVRHDGTTVETLSTPGYGEEEDAEQGFIAAVLDWFTHLL